MPDMAWASSVPVKAGAWFLAAHMILLPSAVVGETTLDVDLSGILAERFSGGPPTDKGLQLRGKYIYTGERFELHAEGRVRWNEAYANTSRYSEAARDAYRFSADWRELFVATQQNDWHYGIGWQQVVWGRADNLRILDQVNPLDFREFVLPDFNEYRKSVFMLRADGQLGDWSAEFLYLPWFVKNQPAKPGSEYYIPVVEPLLDEGYRLLPDDLPSNNLRNGEFGVNFSRTFGSTDLNLIAFYTRDDDPVYRFVSPENPDDATGLRPEYHRQLQIGAGLAHSLEGGFVLPSEVSWLPRVTYNAFDQPDGLAHSPTLRGLIGVDYLWRDWLLSVQASDQYIIDWQSDYTLRQHQPIFTVSAAANSFSAKLETRLAVSAMPHDDGQLWQMKNIYKPDDSWAYGLAIDVFSGPSAGYFGQFGNRDRIRLEVRHQF
jgi:hypothetical protein